MGRTGLDILTAADSTAKLARLLKPSVYRS